MGWEFSGLCYNFTIYEAGSSLYWDDGTYESVSLHLTNKDIIVYWVPSHVGIRDDEKVHYVAKCAQELPSAKVGVIYNDFKHKMNHSIMSNWQGVWNGAVANKLHSVKLVLEDVYTSNRLCRKNEIVLHRVSIRHTHLTHSYILKKDSPPQCEHCQCILTVPHILMVCNHHAQGR